MSRFLVTGALGCIGAWTLYHLTQAGKSAVVLDVSTTPTRPRLLMDDEQVAQVQFIQGDITDLGQVERVVADQGITHIIHLAALQVPFCRADPPLGARVNVVGTVNIFEAARRSQGGVRGIVYASSVAVFGAPDDYPEGPVADNAALLPTTLYGVYKQANEGTARVYWQDWQVPSIGLRPATVYGVARDQGMTSSPTKAMLAAALGKPYRVPFGGYVGMQWASDVAQAFIQSVEAEWPNAGVFNLGGAPVSVAEILRLIETVAPDSAGQLTAADNQLPFPYDFEDAGLQAAIGPVPRTPLAEGVAATVTRFRELAQAGLVDERGLN